MDLPKITVSSPSSSLALMAFYTKKSGVRKTPCTNAAILLEQFEVSKTF
jgi:hypothetical protein